MADLNRPYRMRALRQLPSVCTVMTAMALACRGAPSGGVRGGAGWIGSVDSTADSVVVWTTNPYDSDWPPLNIVDSVHVLFDGDELISPSWVVVSPTGELVVADRRYLLVVDTVSRTARTIGRPGKGPGEYSMIHGVAAWPGDSLLVFDGYQLRLTWHTWDGAVIRTQRLSPTGWKRALGRRTELRVFHNTAVLAWRPTLVRTDGTPDTVVLEAYDLTADTGTVVAEIEDITWVRAPTITGPRYPFGPRALYTVGRAGRFAYAEGVEYCFTLRHLVAATVRRACRGWTPQPVGTANKPPACLSDDELGDLGATLRGLVGAQEYGRTMHSIEEIRLDDEERLWVRVVDSTYTHHPFYRAQLPRLRPSHYTWEIFDRSGRLTAKVALPSRFTPLDFHQGRAYGTVERDDGTRAVASVRYSRR